MDRDDIRPARGSVSLSRQPRTGTFKPGKPAQRPVVSLPPERMLLSVVVSLAIASVPVFSYQESLSRIPQYIAAIAAVLALIGVLWQGQVPRIHPAMLAYIGLTMLFGITLIWRPWEWHYYQTMLKVCLLSLAIHLVIRSPRQVLVVFAMYSVIAGVTLILNVDELRYMRHSIELEKTTERFAGTLANANLAGLYGVMAMLGALIVFANVTHWGRWLVLIVGTLSGFAIMFYTGSRKAMLGILVVCLAIPWLTWQPTKARSGSSGRVLLTLLVLLLACLLLPYLPHASRLLDLLGGEGVTAEASSASRYLMATTAVRLWCASPVWGHGYNGFRQLSGFETYSHSTITEALCNGGLVGLVLIGAFYWLPARDLVRKLRTRSTPWERTLAISLLAYWVLFTLFSVFAVMLDSRDYIPMCAAICGYLQAERSRLQGSHPSGAGRRRRRPSHKATAAGGAAEGLPISAAGSTPGRDS